MGETQTVQDALDAARHRETMAAAARGEVEWLTPEETLAFVAAATPLAFWRKKRGMTQKALATQAGISQSYMAELEAGKRLLLKHVIGPAFALSEESSNRSNAGQHVVFKWLIHVCTRSL